MWCNRRLVFGYFSLVLGMVLCYSSVVGGLLRVEADLWQWVFELSYARFYCGVIILSGILMGYFAWGNYAGRYFVYGLYLLLFAGLAIYVTTWYWSLVIMLFALSGLFLGQGINIARTSQE